MSGRLTESERMAGAETIISLDTKLIDRLKTENDRLREALREYGQHTSWRCEHPPHYYYAAHVARNPDAGCPCGLDKALRELRINA